MSDTPVRTDNDFFMGSNGSVITTALPVQCRTRQQAYRLAAWVVLAAYVLPDEEIPSSFEEVQQAIRET